MLQSSERERERVRDELTRELAEAHQQLKQKVTKHSNNNDFLLMLTAGRSATIQ